MITAVDARSARVQSKGIGIKADGTAGSVVYDDIVTRRPGGWKISHRKVTARRVALGRQQTGARQVLESFRQAAINQSADEMSRVYALDAVHEFPFTHKGLPSRLEGRDEIVNWMAAGWKAYPLKYERYRTLAIHDTSEPETIVVEQEVLGTSASNGEFALPNIVVLTARNGQIAQLRDYVNILAAAAAMGRDDPDPQLLSPGGTTPRNPPAARPILRILSGARIPCYASAGGTSARRKVSRMIVPPLRRDLATTVPSWATARRRTM